MDAVAFTADGNHVASGGRDGAIRLWEVSTGKALEQVHKHVSLVSALAFSADGEWLAAGTRDGATHLHRMTPAVRAPLWEETNLAFLTVANDKLLVQSQTNGAVQLLDLRSGQPTGAPWSNADGLPAVMGAGSVWKPVALSPDSRILATFSPMTNRQAQIQFRDPTTGRTVGDAIAITNAFCLEISPEGKTLAGLSGDGSIQLWDVATRQPRARLALPRQMEVTWVGLRWSPNGRYLATHSGFMSWHVWDVAQGQLVHSTLDTVWMAISPDWQYAFGLPGGLADFRDPRQPQPRHPITEDPMVGSAEFSPHGQLLAVALGDNTVQMWNTASGQRVGGPMKTTGRVTWMGFTPDGRVLVTAESGERDPAAAPLVSAHIRLWDATTTLSCGRPIPPTRSSSSLVLS